MKINIFNIGELTLFYRIHSNGEYYKWYQEYGLVAWHRYDSWTWSWVLWLILGKNKRGNKGIFHFQKQSVVKKS